MMHCSRAGTPAYPLQGRRHRCGLGLGRVRHTVFGLSVSWRWWWWWLAAVYSREKQCNANCLNENRSMSPKKQLRDTSRSCLPFERHRKRRPCISDFPGSWVMPVSYLWTRDICRLLILSLGSVEFRPCEDHLLFGGDQFLDRYQPREHLSKCGLLTGLGGGLCLRGFPCLLLLVCRMGAVSR